MGLSHNKWWLSEIQAPREAVRKQQIFPKLGSSLSQAFYSPFLPVPLTCCCVRCACASHVLLCPHIPPDAGTAL